MSIHRIIYKLNDTLKCTLKWLLIIHIYLQATDIHCGIQTAETHGQPEQRHQPFSKHRPRKVKKLDITKARKQVELKGTIGGIAARLVLPVITTSHPGLARPGQADGEVAQSEHILAHAPPRISKSKKSKLLNKQK